ncbi:PAS domain-containing sensor histidine kinase [Pontibacter pamirensis]|uniref:PAS domain-containing sensor histidine kinase n=1 Tax=Pontibacter pamirensis TaxID=2562824 RepID=UPI0013897AB4|nr:sensor histidine kinase [Pontibacter pamirensis]
MPNSKKELNTSENNKTSPEAQILALQEANKQLRSENTAVLAKLERQEDVEERYRESQSRFEVVFYQSVLGQKIIAQDLRITQVNEALQQMMGYSKAELIGTRIVKFAHPDFIHDWKVLQTKLWEEQIPAFQIETCLVKKDGSIFWCQVTSILFRDQDVSLGFTILEDIDRRKALEQELKKLYDNQETIMHMVAHDLKSPFFNIKLAAGFLKENLEELQAKERGKQDQNFTYVSLISDTSDKALALIDDLLLIGEVESTYEALEETDLKAYIQFHLSNLSIGARRKDISVTFHSPEKPVYARINQDKFRRVLENLLSNAVKFTNRNGQVTINLKKEGKKAVLLVQDNGIGIPAELVASVFDKFTKARRIGTYGEPTTGLGLYIVKQIIDKHRGKVWVESQENAGTTVFVELL